MKIIFVSILTFCFMTVVSAQNKQLPSEKLDTMKLLCSKWVLVRMSYPEKSTDVPVAEAMYVTYNVDGNYTDSSARFGVSHGTWTYDNSNKLLTITESGRSSRTKLVKATFDELVMEIEYPTITVTALYKQVDKN